MPIYRLQCSWQSEGSLPRDKVMITPHFNVSQIDSAADPDQLCGDLLTALQGWSNWIGEVRVTAYDAQGTQPVYPVGDAAANVGATQNSNGARELALCLSFYNERNVGRRRGRLYVPFFVALGLPPDTRPTQGMQAKVMALGPIFTNLGGANTDWCIFSRVDNVGRKVTNYYVDNEWDVVRSRGLRATARESAVTDE